MVNHRNNQLIRCPCGNILAGYDGRSLTIRKKGRSVAVASSRANVEITCEDCQRTVNVLLDEQAVHVLASPVSTAHREKRIPDVVMDADLHIQNFFLADNIRYFLAQLPQRLICRVQPCIFLIQSGAHGHQLGYIRGDNFGIVLPIAVRDFMLRKAQGAPVRKVINAGHGGIFCDGLRGIFQHGLQLPERLNTAVEKHRPDRKHPAIHQPDKPFGRKNADGGGA